MPWNTQVLYVYYLPSMKVYNIPATLWHNTITQTDTKMVLIEDSSTGMNNSDILSLNAEQSSAVQALVK